MNSSIKKVISTTLVATIISGTVILTNQTSVKASEVSTNLHSILKMSNEDAIKIIEQNYLIRNNDGTFKIHSNAEKVIPQENLKVLSKAMNEVNSKIKSKELYSTKSLDGTIIIDKTNTGLKRSYNGHASNYRWFWWGFVANLDKAGSNMLINDLEALRDASGAVGILAGLASCGIAVAGGAINAGLCIELIRETKNALAETEYGCTIHCYGAPSSAQVYKITAQYD